MKSFSVVIAIAVYCCISFQSVSAGIVVGTFDSIRAGDANLATGLITSDARTSLLANFPVTFATADTLTPAFLSGIDLLILTPSTTGGFGITPLTSDEQSAIFDFALGGGDVLMVADGYASLAAASKSFTKTFGATLVPDNLVAKLACSAIVPNHPIFDGPFGTQTTFTVYAAGLLTPLGPYATSLAKMDLVNQSVLAVIESGILGPGSGRIVMYTDATLFASNNSGGFFSANETLFLNTVAYLVPEPSSFALAAVGLLALVIGGRKR